MFCFKRGALTNAIDNEAMIVLDEVNLLRMDVQTALLGMLEGRRLSIADEDFDPLPSTDPTAGTAARGALIVATMNPVHPHPHPHPHR